MTLDDIDHLYEATQHVAVTPQCREDHYQRAQAHALVDIAQSLRVLKDYITAPPIRFVVGNNEGVI